MNKNNQSMQYKNGTGEQFLVRSWYHFWQFGYPSSHFLDGLLITNGSYKKRGHSFRYNIPDFTLLAEGLYICELEKELCQTLSAPFWTFSWIDRTGIACGLWRNGIGLIYKKEFYEFKSVCWICEMKQI